MFEILKRALGLSVPADPEPPVAFGYKIDWLAVRSDDSDGVIAALRAADPRYRSVKPCSWSYGIERAYRMGRQAFVTPPIDGWTLIAGWPPPDDLPEVLASLGEALGTRVCFFGNHRGVSYAAFGFADDGRVVRLYSHADGETFHDVGEPTADERELGLRFYAEIDDVDEDEEDALFEAMPDEETVHLLAARWSVNPNAEDWQAREPSTGWLIA